MKSHHVNHVGIAPVIGNNALYVKQDRRRVAEICGSHVYDVLNDGVVEF